MFLAIEQREPHAGQLAFADVEQPSSYAERQALAVRCRDEFQIPFRILVDGMDDASRALFGDLPSPAFIIESTGRIAAKLPWSDPELIADGLNAVERAAESRSTQPSDMNEVIALARKRMSVKAHAEARILLTNAIRSMQHLSPATLAEAHLALASACRGEGNTGDATTSATEAEVLARKAWSSNPARLVAALCELAALEPPGPSADARWAAAAAALEFRAPISQRTWIEAHSGGASTRAASRPTR